MPKLFYLLDYFYLYLLYYFLMLLEVLLSYFNGILFGMSLFGYLLTLWIASGFPVLKTEPWMFFLKLIPELFFDTKSIFFYLLLSYFFLNIFVATPVAAVVAGTFYLESLDNFFDYSGGF